MGEQGETSSYMAIMFVTTVRKVVDEKKVTGVQKLIHILV